MSFSFTSSKKTSRNIMDSFSAPSPKNKDYKFQPIFSDKDLNSRIDEERWYWDDPNTPPPIVHLAPFTFQPTQFSSTEIKLMAIPAPSAFSSAVSSSSAMTDTPSSLDLNSAKSEDDDSSGADSQVEDEDDTTSSSSGSSHEIVTLKVKVENAKKPNFSLAHLKNSTTISMLPKFLAEMDAANRSLEVERTAGTLIERRIEVEEVDVNVRKEAIDVKINREDAGRSIKTDPYIEMNLGLGVLEHKDVAGTTSISSLDVSEDKINGKENRSFKLKRSHAEDGEGKTNKRPKIEEL